MNGNKEMHAEREVLKDKRSVRDAGRTFLMTTSVKGVSKTIRSKAAFLKVLWGLAVLFGGSFALYLVIDLFMNYYDYPTVTRIESVVKRSAFPDVTFCNKFPLSKHFLRDFPPELYFRELYDLSHNNKYNYLQYYYEAGNELNITQKEVYDFAAMFYSTSGYFQTVRPSTDASDPRSKKLGEIGRRFIRECSFYDWDMNFVDLECDAETLASFYYPQYHECYTLHIPDDFKTKIRGVSMVLYLDQTNQAHIADHYLHIAHTITSGVFAHVHTRDRLPFPLDGYTAPAGMETTIRLSPMEIEYLPEPYGTCTDRKYIYNTTYIQGTSLDTSEADISSIGREKKTYTSDACLSLCKQEVIIKECGCIDPTYGYTDEQLYRGQEVESQEDMDMIRRTPFCINSSAFVDSQGLAKDGRNAFKGVTKRVMCSIRARNKWWEELCACPRACAQKLYGASITQAPWPLRSQELGIYSTYIYNRDIEGDFWEYKQLSDGYKYNNISGEEIHAKLSRMDKIRENFLQVNIMFGDERVETIREVPQITWSTILANLGGTLNLWIGISFITLIELIDMLYNMVTSCVTSCSEREDGEAQVCNTNLPAGQSQVKTGNYYPQVYSNKQTSKMGVDSTDLGYGLPKVHT